MALHEGPLTTTMAVTKDASRGDKLRAYNLQGLIVLALQFNDLNARPKEQARRTLRERSRPEP